MKRIILTALSIVTFGSASFAQTETAIETDQAVVFEQEDGAIAPQDLDQMQSFGVVEYRGGDAGNIIGGIIGGIIGAIGADHWDKQHNRPNRFVTCFAQNKRGQTFRATARRARAAQDLAMKKCYNNSRSCRPVGCR